MKSKMFQEMIGNIDDDLIVAADVRVVPMKKKNILKLVSGLAAACLVAACAIVVIPIIQSNHISPTDPVNEAGGLNGMINIRQEIQVEGSNFEFTNEEGYTYLDSVRTGIQNSLKAMGVNADNIEITKSGYSHVRTGDSGNSIAVNWKDYIAYNGDEIIAIITVMKDEAGFHEYLAWGSQCYADYGKFLAEHKGEELVYIYAGDVDAILAPDNQIYAFGTDISSAVNENEAGQYYTFFKMEQNTYIPK